MRLLLIIGLVVIGLAAVGVLAVMRFVRRPLPTVRGNVIIAGITDQVRISRDRSGIPHIDAGSMKDAAFAMGYVHAQDRLWQLELTRRVASGRISEFAGSEGLDADRFLRRVGLMRIAREEEQLLDDETRGMLDAYAAGINAIIAQQRPLPLEFQLLHITPEPWQPVHSIAAAKLLALSLSLDWDVEIQRLNVVRALGPEKAAKLECFYPDTNPTILGGKKGAALLGKEVLHLYQEAAKWLPAVHGGSNAWVVSGKRTASGRPLLANDPHLAPAVPSAWYAAHIRAGDDFESTGVTTMGMPFTVLGHNQYCAWGYTNSFADSQDLVVEEFDGPAGRRYKTHRGYATTGLEREIIHVKGASDYVEEVLVTRHGPIIERFHDAHHETSRGFALQWTALKPASAMQALLALQRTRDWDTFRAAFAQFDAPSQNVVYADVEGHIGYFLSGRIPVRSQKALGIPVIGWTDHALWERYLTQDEVPQQLDPPKGVFITANNRIVGKDFPSYVARDYMNGYRAARIHELLGDKKNLTADSMRSIQMDVVCPPARDVVVLLQGVECPSTQGEALRKRLIEWDGNMEAQKSEPMLYEAFMRRFVEHALKPFCGDDWKIVAGTTASHPVFGYPGNIIGRVLPMLIDKWRAQDKTLLADSTTWKDIVGFALDDAARDLGKRRGRLMRRWGHVHAMPLTHPMGKKRPLGMIFNAGNVRVGGNLDTVHATSYAPSTPYATTLWAPSWRQVIDVGQWGSSTGILFPGQSGHPGSRHYKDLTKVWLRNEQRPLAWTTDEVKQAAKHTLTLSPSLGTPAVRPKRRTRVKRSV